MADIYFKNGKPYTESQLRRDMLPTAMPRKLTEAHFEAAGAKRLVERQRPAYNPETHVAEQAIEDVDGAPTRTWQVRAKPMEELVDAAVSGKRSEIAMQYRDALAPVQAKYSQSEINGWPQQEAEAAAFIANADADVPMLRAMSKSSGETVEAMALHIAEKVSQYKAIYGAAQGRKRAREKALEAIDLTADDALDKIKAI